MEIKNPTSVLLSTDPAKRMGEEILKRLAPSLKLRGVPSDSFIMVNIANSEFVTGKTASETGLRFASMHPGAQGWMARFGDVMGEPTGVVGASAGAPRDAEDIEESSPQRGGRSRSFSRREQYQAQSRR